MQPSTTKTLTTDCCIVGAGPAGMMLGYLLARAGVRTLVLEKHADFLHDFRGNTLHPSTMQLMYRLGLLDSLLALPHQRTARLEMDAEGGAVPLADFSWLPVKCRFIAFINQWDFLNLLAAEAEKLPAFTLLRATHSDSLRTEQGQVTGICASNVEGRLEIKAELVVGCDGRHSLVRQQAGMLSQSFGMPNDVVWFQLNKRPEDPAVDTGHRGSAQNLIIIDRGDFWQCGLPVAKGEFSSLLAAGMPAFRQRLAQTAPFTPERLEELQDIEQLKLLDIRIDRLDHWAKPGVLCIGDAAHAMSPVGGVGINLAIQDAVATARLLTPALLNGNVTVHQLARVQHRRQFPTRATQFIQLKMSGKKRAPGEPSPLPRILRRFRFLPYLFGWIIGLGFRQEKPGRHVLRASSR